MSNVLLPHDFSALLFPAGLLVFYLIAWLLVGRDPKIGNVAPQYDPPPGVSPGVARYIITGGSDGTTLAAVLASMGAKGVIAIQPAENCYQLELLNPTIPVWPEEAAIAKTVFHVDLPTQAYTGSHTAIVGAPDSTTGNTQQGRATLSNDLAAMSLSAASVGPARTQAVVNPALTAEIKTHIDAIQDTFRKNLRGIYFRQNFIYSGIGALATFIWGLATAFTIEAQSSIFTTFWLLMFT